MAVKKIEAYAMGYYMSKQNCTNCGYAYFFVTKSGKLDFENGVCNYVVELPHSYRVKSGGLLLKKGVSIHTKLNCPKWIEKH